MEIVTRFVNFRMEITFKRFTARGGVNLLSMVELFGYYGSNRNVLPVLLNRDFRVFVFAYNNINSKLLICVFIRTYSVIMLIVINTIIYTV